MWSWGAVKVTMSLMVRLMKDVVDIPHFIYKDTYRRTNSIRLPKLFDSRTTAPHDSRNTVVALGVR